MLYYLFNFLEHKYQFPGAGLFQYISFRASFALIFSLIISIFFGNKIIKILTKNKIGEKVRVLGLSGEKNKNGTPTMGGIIIIIGTIVPVLLLSKFKDIYIILLIFTTLWMGTSPTASGLTCLSPPTGPPWGPTSSRTRLPMDRGTRFLQSASSRSSRVERAKPKDLMRMGLAQAQSSAVQSPGFW